MLKNVKIGAKLIGGFTAVALIAAVICRQLDIAGRFAGPDAWLQGHALWHVLTSLSLGCMYFYHRSEVTTPIDRAALEKQPNYL